MTCLRLDQSILAACRNSKPGISTLYLANYADVTAFTLNAAEDLVATISGTTASGETSGFFYSIALNKESSGIVDEATINIPNGTSIYSPTVTAKISSMDQTTRTIFKELSQADVIAIWKDIDGLYYVAGRYNGLSMSTGTFGTGTASGDFKGLEFSLTGIEPSPVIQVDPAFDMSTIIVA